MIGYQDTQPIICEPVPTHDSSCLQIVTNCPRPAVRSISRRGGAATTAKSSQDKHQKHKNPQKNMEVQQATGYTIYTRGHNTRRTEEPPPQVNKDLSGGLLLFFFFFCGGLGLDVQIRCLPSNGDACQNCTDKEKERGLAFAILCDCRPWRGKSFPCVHLLR